MTTSRGKKFLILICGLFENLVFTGNIFGWSALNHMLKQEGVFRYLCEDESSVSSRMIYHHDEVSTPAVDFGDYITINTNATDYETLPSIRMLSNYSIYEPQSYIQLGCPTQDKILNLAFTMGSFFNGFTAFIWGFLLESWGLRTVRLVINFFLTFGSLLLCFTSKDNPLLIFPAVIFLCGGGVPLRIANMQIANYFPENRAAIITFYSGAFSSSAIIFVILKYLFDAGLSYFATCLTLFVCSLVLLPITLFLLPSDRIREESATGSSENLMFNKKQYARNNLANVTPVTLENFRILSSPRFDRKQLTKEPENSIMTIKKLYQIENGSTVKRLSQTSVESKEPDLPLKISLWSLPFILHQWWYSWLITYMILYIGSMNLWLERVTSDVELVGHYTKVYGIAQVLSLVLAPFAGFLMDWQVKKAGQEPDAQMRKLKTYQAGFWPMIFTTGTLGAILICKFYDNHAAIYASIVFITLLRSFLVAVASAYLRIRFPGEHFNRLLGIMSTFGSVITLLQFPLFIWESAGSAIWVNIFNCVCTVLALLNPLHLIINPLQRHLIAKETKQQ